MTLGWMLQGTSLKSRPMLRTRLTRHAATFWAFVVYMPRRQLHRLLVAMVAIAVGGNCWERAMRVRQHPLFWPIAAMGWMLRC